jgi:hypothetical protein
VPASRRVASVKKRAASSKPNDGQATTIRTTVVIDRALVFDVEEKLLELRRVDAAISWSGFVEVALRQLLKRGDLVNVVRKSDLGLRRKG